MILFQNFKSWKAYCLENQVPVFQPVLDYEIREKGTSEIAIREGLLKAYTVMKEAVQTGLTENMQSRSGMVNNSGKKVFNSPITVLSPEF